MKLNVNVISLKQTCSACPSQWEGKTEEGNDIYIRYRWGYLRVDINGEPALGILHGGEWDGSLATEDMLELTGITLQDKGTNTL